MADGHPSKILIATTNQGKFKEIYDLLHDGVEAEFVSLADVGEMGDPPAETGDTYEDNALIKARYYAERSGLPAVADDSGLEILALGGWPGLNSTTPLGDGRKLSDPQLVEVVLRRMERYPVEAQRRARFVCAAAYVDLKKQYELVVRGSLYGVIGKHPKGKTGFGYDPIFWLPDTWKTLAQMSTAEKNRYSHRRNAFITLKPRIIHEFVKSAGYAL
ncbi:MAG: RdgB/HAM1 family non-canonical purine NTP pyrophosphatase [bacterium]